MKNKTVLLSGANGYIAQHLAQMLKKHQYKVVTATRGKNGDVNMDFSCPPEVATLRVQGIDTMIHTVSPNEFLYRSDTYRALAENATGIHAALDFCKNNHIRNFIYFSSFHVFGNQGGELNEYTPISPRNDYGLAHSTAEQTVQMYDRSGQLNGWVIRPSNLFGVPVNLPSFKRWNLIPFAFCKEAIEHRTITLQTSGRQLRNFVGVTDVCKRALWILQEEPTSRIVHSYGRLTLSVLEYAELIQRIARERFDIPVVIHRPEGSEVISEFDFTSIHNHTFIQPSEEIKDFIFDMLQSLLETSRSNNTRGESV